MTTSYTYDGTQVDRLTSFGGKAITYDANGCVNTYDSWTYTWTKGKLTKRVRGTRLSGIDTYTYTYDAYGRRTSKNYSFMKGTQALAAYMTSSSTNYIYDASGRLIREQYTEIFNDLSSNSREIIYLYDENGVIGVMYSYNGSTSAAYFYRRNLQGDVTAIYNSSGSKVGEYAYDAWGNCTILSGASNDLVSNNPIRYRGYYFDSETGCYYLSARYYNPQWRRFISPDSTEYLDPETPNGLNLYAYCNNDPVNYVDPSGNFAISATFGIGALIAITVTSMIIGGGVQLASNALAGETGSNLWRGVAGAAFGTGVNALILCLSMPAGVASLFIAAGASTIVQTGVDTIETLIRNEKVGWNIVLDLGINFATILAGNYLGGKLIPINSGWIKPQFFKSIFIKPYGQKILGQTVIGAGLSGIINYIRKFDWSIFESILPVSTVPLYQKDYTGWK